MNAANFKLVVCCMVAMFITSNLEAKNASVIYGLDKARHFTSSKQGPFFVQAGAFLSKQLARQLQAKLTASMHYPVQIHIVGKYHSVVIGPLPSMAAVHAIGGVRAAEVAKQAPIAVPQKPIVMAQALIPVKRKPAVIKTYPFKSLPPLLNNGIANNWFVATDLGVMHTNIKKVMTVHNGSNYPPPLDTDEYSVAQPTPMMLDFMAGHRWQRNQQWLPAYALALRYQHLYSHKANGRITQFSIPEFENYSYSWKLAADTLSLYSKFDLTQYKRVMPYVDAGIGVSLNRSKNYYEVAYHEVMPRISPAYGSGSNTHLTYNLGAGIDVILTPKLLLSLGYDYQQFGGTTSGFGQGARWSREQLDLGNTSSNMALLGMTYLIDGSPFERKSIYK